MLFRSRIDTFRSSGAGGQHVNTTDSAVRITHIPSGIVVACQQERSQHKNRATAWNMLRARLYEAELKKREEKASAEAAAKTDIGWGHQIRSYVLQPYQMVKDLRTGAQSTSPQDVLDGDLDRHTFYRTAQRAEALGTFLFDARDLFVCLLQRFPDRCEHPFHGLFAVSEVAERELLLLAEHLTGDLQEELTVAAQRVARHRIEARSQPLERKVERLRPLAGDLFGGGELGASGGELDLQRMRTPAADQPADEQRDRKGEHQQQRQHDRGSPGRLHQPGSIAPPVRRSCIT